MAYGDGLENRCRCKPTVGSNPTPSVYLERAKRVEGFTDISILYLGVAIQTNHTHTHLKNIVYVGILENYDYRNKAG